MKTETPGIDGTEFQITLHEQDVLDPPISSLLIIEKNQSKKILKCLARGIGIQNIKQNSNKMNVKLVSITKSLIEEKELSPEWNDHSI